MSRYGPICLGRVYSSEKKIRNAVINTRRLRFQDLEFLIRQGSKIKKNLQKFTIKFFAIQLKFI